jgi:hypothetical protein
MSLGVATLPQKMPKHQCDGGVALPKQRSASTGGRWLFRPPRSREHAQTADFSTPLPRISRGTLWRRRTSCAFA